MSTSIPFKKIKLEEECTSNDPGPSELSHPLNESVSDSSEEETSEGETSEEESSDEETSEEDAKRKTKWTFLQHEGPVFAPPYKSLPDDVRFFYDGQLVKLSPKAEEVAGFYAKMLYHEYTTKQVFNNNFFIDWRKVMTSDEKELIKDLSKCDFKEMHAYLNKKLTKAQKAENKAKEEEIKKKYGFCNVNGMKEEIANFKLTPPGLFKGRGKHPKMGMLRRRVMPEYVTINCSADSNIPKPPQGHTWERIKNDNTVLWLASWRENVQNELKYVLIKETAHKNRQKFEKARELHKYIDNIRNKYMADLVTGESMFVRQCAVAVYFIDLLALRPGNKKDEDTKADTVGCCTLRVEHITLHKEKDDKENVVVFDFLGKDSIRYYNEVSVEEPVFQNLKQFMESKNPTSRLFNSLSTVKLNGYLKDLMPGLTAKIFRTYNASVTLQKQLDELTDPDATESEKINAYNTANLDIAILCNHQQTVRKAGFNDQLDKVEEDLRKSKIKGGRESPENRLKVRENKQKSLERLKNQLKTLESQDKKFAIGTSIQHYADPRITIAWCKKHKVPIEKIFKGAKLRKKFKWADREAGPDYRF